MFFNVKKEKEKDDFKKLARLKLNKTFKIFNMQ